MAEERAWTGMNCPDRLPPPKASQWSTGDAIGMWNAAQIRIAGTSRARSGLDNQSQIHDPTIFARAGSAVLYLLYNCYDQLIVFRLSTCSKSRGLSILLFIPEYPHWLRTYFAYTQGKIQQPQRNLFDPRYCIDTLNHLFIFVLLLFVCLYLFIQMTWNA